MEIRYPSTRYHRRCRQCKCMRWNQAAFIILQNLRFPSRYPMKCKSVCCLPTDSCQDLFLAIPVSSKAVRIGPCKPDPELSDIKISPGTCWRKLLTASSFYSSLGGGKLHAFGKASFVLTIPAMVFGNSWEAATVGQEPLCCVTGCPFLYPCFLQVLHVLSEEVLYLRYHKYSWCSYSPCNLGYYPWAHPSGELGTGRYGEKKRNAFFFKSLRKKSLCTECFFQPGYQGHSVKKVLLELIFSLCCSTTPWH